VLCGVIVNLFQNRRYTIFTVNYLVDDFVLNVGVPSTQFKIKTTSFSVIKMFTLGILVLKNGFTKI